MSQDYLNAVADASEAGSTAVADGKQFQFKMPIKAIRVKCVECEFGRSKAKEDGTGNSPMLTRKWEVVSPEKVRIKQGDEKVEVAIAGLKVTDWLVMTAKTAQMVKKDSARLGVELPDDETPNVNQYLGKEGVCIIETTEQKRVDEETNEPICHSDGTPVIRYNHRIAEWLN